MSGHWQYPVFVLYESDSGILYGQWASSKALLDLFCAVSRAACSERGLGQRLSTFESLDASSVLCMYAWQYPSQTRNIVWTETDRTGKLTSSRIWKPWYKYKMIYIQYSKGFCIILQKLRNIGINSVDNCLIISTYMYFLEFICTAGRSEGEGCNRFWQDVIA